MTGSLDLYVPAGAQHKGELSIEGNARIDGEFIGTLYCNGSITVGVHGRVEGRVECQRASISGTFLGDVHAFERCLLFQTAHFEGAIDTMLINIQEGCTIKGEILAKGSHS